MHYTIGKAGSSKKDICKRPRSPSTTATGFQSFGPPRTHAQASKRLFEDHLRRAACEEAAGIGLTRRRRCRRRELEFRKDSSLAGLRPVLLQEVVDLSRDP